MTVHELEEVGCEVRVSHFRPAPGLDPGRYFSRFDLARYDAKRSAFASRGGLTFAVIVLPDGHGFVGAAACSKRDNFSRKRGREIALGRAWAEAEVAYLEGGLEL